MWCQKERQRPALVVGSNRWLTKYALSPVRLGDDVSMNMYLPKKIKTLESFNQWKLFVHANQKGWAAKS
jgi:hypothetical protein